MKKGQFSRDWSLLKLARTWEPRDIGGEVIERVLREGAPEAVMDILHVIRDIGFEDGEKAKERMPPFMQPAEILESTLLVAGVQMEREEEGSGEDGLVITVHLDETGLFDYPFTMAEPAAAYVAGFVQAVAGAATVSRSGNFLLIHF
ncbi:hypothetical protein L1S32_04075 [Methanogenium sp. S4BF]|uniref:hypothetical protein n=1 Tax=Methanogenium sp. S4BF TaxID=1789226 RepID=UPI002417BD5D|nr:hypothetical protein [Methanogenium sp. S4BF]WFN35306.1 hypothetical protein L1S32_04075 [Methanogenium sp. S4BF]